VEADTVGNIKLRPVSLEEEIALEAYREAIKAGLASADGAADKILTAALSIGTAYAGLLALVKPEKEAAPTVLALPFIAFGVAALFGAWALSKGVQSLSELNVDKVRSAVDDTLKAKRLRIGVGILGIVAGLGLAAFVVFSAYGAGAVTCSGVECVDVVPDASPAPPTPSPTAAVTPSPTPTQAPTPTPTVNPTPTQPGGCTPSHTP
jgi:hypothetical protein